jgi:hypothetical protein
MSEATCIRPHENSLHAAIALANEVFPEATFIITSTDGVRQ